MKARAAAVAMVMGLMAATAVRAADYSSGAPVAASGPEITGSEGVGSAAEVAPETPASGLKTSYELDADASYVRRARTNFGFGQMGKLSEVNSEGRLVVSPQWNDGPIYRFGLAYERYDFGPSQAAPVPDILASESLVLGMDFQLFNSWLCRVEVDPGLYGDARSTGFRNFNVPFLIGGSYIAGETLQWVVGLEVDVQREYPVLPAVGLRWTVSDNWTVDAVMPTPRLEYEWDKNTTLYLGGDFKDGTYRVDRGFGGAVGRPRLNDAIVEYDEIRIGSGLSWKAGKGVTLEMEGGYLPYREFNFHHSDTHFGNDSGAPYGQVSVNAQF